MANTVPRAKTAALSGTALAAVIGLAAPGLAAAAPAQPAVASPSPASSARSADYEKHMTATRSAGYIKFQSEFTKLKDLYSVAGTDGGHVVLEDSRGNLFYVDPATGDQKFVSRSMLIKCAQCGADPVGRSANPYLKRSTDMAIVGVDQDGRTIMRNKSGQAFTLDVATGDMIFIK